MRGGSGGGGGFQSFWGACQTRPFVIRKIERKRKREQENERETRQPHQMNTTVSRTGGPEEHLLLMDNWMRVNLEMGIYLSHHIVGGVLND